MSAVQAAQRVAILLGVVAAGVGAMVWWRPSAGVAGDAVRLTYVNTAEQQGVIGYRDPVGAISRDGLRLVFAEGRRLYETPVGGGARVTLADADGQIRHVAPDNLGAWLFEDTAAKTRWWLASSRAPMRPLFGTRTEITETASGDSTPTRRRVDQLRQIAASVDGKWLAGCARWRFVGTGSLAYRGRRLERAGHARRRSRGMAGLDAERRDRLHDHGSVQPDGAVAPVDALRPVDAHDHTRSRGDWAARVWE